MEYKVKVKSLSRVRLSAKSMAFSRPEYNLAIKKEWNNAICSNMMDQEIIMLSEVSQTKYNIA